MNSENKDECNEKVKDQVNENQNLQQLRSVMRKSSMVKPSLREVKLKGKLMERQDSKGDGDAVPSDKSGKDKRLNQEKIEDQKIREKIKAMPQGKKDITAKKKAVPLLAKPAQQKPSSTNAAVVAKLPQKIASGLVPRYQKRKHLSPAVESAFTRHIVNSNPGSRNVSPTVSRRRKTLSPVNPTRIPLPATSERKVPVQGSSNGRRPQSPNYSESAILGEDSACKRVEKVKRARLYLLQQMGPNSFLIGGDSPDNKYRVIIGSQVEALFKTFHARRTSKLKELNKKNKSKPKRDPSIEKEDDEEVESEQSTPEDHQAFDEDSQGTDEDNCPICLLDMVEGESLLQCINGCQNRLHHHCIDIWFQNCKRQNEQLTCPLCRVKWPSQQELDVASVGETLLPVPPNTRVPSPVPHREVEIELPHVEPIAEEHLETAKQWIPIFGEDLVACMFSRNWSDRETSLKQLSHLAHVNHQNLMLGVEENADSVSPPSSSPRQVSPSKMLEGFCHVLTYMLRDPVYRVFVAALKALRSVLGYTPCRNVMQKKKLEIWLKPIVESVLLKCADSNKKMCLLSISTLQELIKGQTGELALGRELENPGTYGINGIEYMLDCIIKEYDRNNIQWHWVLGRCQVLESVIEEYPREFIVQRQLTKRENSEHYEEIIVNFDRIKQVLNFVTNFLNFTHFKVKVLANRIFYRTAKLQLADHFIFKEVLELLNNVDTTVQVRLRRKLLKVEENYRLVNHVDNMPVEENGLVFETELVDDFDPIFTTPVLSPCNSPRSLSPVPSELNVPAINIAVDIAINNIVQNELLAPPNSPRKLNKRRYRTHPEKKCRGNKQLSSSDGFLPLTNIQDKAYSDTTGPSATSSPGKLGSLSSPSTPRAVGDIPGSGVHSPPTPLALFNVPVDIPSAHSTDYTEKHMHLSLTDLAEAKINVKEANLLLDSTEHDIVREGSDDITTQNCRLEELNKSSSQDKQQHSLYQQLVELEQEDGFSYSSEPCYDIHPLNNSTNEDVNDGNLLDLEDGFMNEYVGNTDVNMREVYETDGEIFEGETVLIRRSESCCVPSVEVVDDEQFSNPAVADDKLSTAGSHCLNISIGSRCESISVDGDESSHSNEGVALDVVDNEQGADQQEEINRSRSDSISSTQANVSTSSQAGNLTDDLSDILSPSKMKERVSFKTEIATSPQHSSSSHSSSNERTPEGTQEDCHCKEEVEKEEAQALVAAMEQSNLDQSKLPFVPGLSHEEDETLTIHIQQESTDGLPDPIHSYMESVDWTKGPMLGTGAFSTCYQARDNKTGTIMCVKQISFCRNSMSEQEKVVEAVEEEIQMMAKLNHPNIVRILGATQQGTHFFMFVEWMPGGSVSYLLDMYGVFSKQVMVSYTLQILRGLAYLHENHVLHRDLKGANLLVDSTGQRVRIGDFGASARLASRQTGAGEFQGQLLGTIAFMAPEVLRGESYGRSCDIWSVGCSIIEMATTKPPWGASGLSNHLALIFKIASTQNAPPVPEGMFPPLRDLTLRCLEVNREERPSAKDLLQHPLFTMDKR